jgi:hypothetical protein
VRPVKRNGNRNASRDQRACRNGAYHLHNPRPHPQPFLWRTWGRERLDAHAGNLQALDLLAICPLLHITRTPSYFFFFLPLDLCYNNNSPAYITIYESHRTRFRSCKSPIRWTVQSQLVRCAPAFSAHRSTFYFFSCILFVQERGAAGQSVSRLTKCYIRLRLRLRHRAAGRMNHEPGPELFNSSRDRTGQDNHTCWSMLLLHRVFTSNESESPSESRAVLLLPSPKRSFFSFFSSQLG